MKFDLGRLVATPAALHSLTREQIILALARHEAGDWGELDAEDQRANEQALTCGARILRAPRDLDHPFHGIVITRSTAS